MEKIIKKQIRLNNNMIKYNKFSTAINERLKADMRSVYNKPF
jgi:hypothetical protein